MPEDKSAGNLKEVGEGLKSILERIADFFDIFDLSFIVSGAVTVGALSFWGWRSHFNPPPIPSGWISAVALIIACYISGLVCFALGRWIRMGWRWRKAEKIFYKSFVRILKRHGLSDLAPFSEYLNRTDARGDWRLFVRLWAEVRDSPALAHSFSLLRRYWVMAATYDGLAMALIVWAMIWLACAYGVAGSQPIEKSLAWPLAGLFCTCSAACLREAGRFVDYQVEELVASIAAARQN